MSIAEPLVFDDERQLGNYLSGLEVPADIASLGQNAISRYYQWCLENGGPPDNAFAENLALWFARQRSVGSKATDRAFQESQGSRYTGNEHWLRIARRKYKKATGHDVPQGMIYVSQLATEPNDPEAWVRDRGDLARRAKELGKGVDEMGIKEAEFEPRQKRAPHLAEDIMQRHLRKAVANPANIGKDVGELRHNITQAHAYNPGKE